MTIVSSRKMSLLLTSKWPKQHPQPLDAAHIGALGRQGSQWDSQGLCSEREWNDRPVLGLLLVTVCVEVPLQGCL